MIVVHGVHPSVEWSCSCPEPTTHPTTPVTNHQLSISLAFLLLIALLFTPHRIAKLACEAGRCEVLRSENE